MKEELIHAIKEDFEAKGYTLEVSVIEDPIAMKEAGKDPEASLARFSAFLSRDQ